jgi:hypothetical protein
MIDARDPASRGAIACGVGVSLDFAAVNAVACFVFATSEEARQFVDEFSTSLEIWAVQIERRPAEDLSEEARQAMQGVLTLLQDATLQRRGRRVRVRGSWSRKDIRFLITNLPEIASLF